MDWFENGWGLSLIVFLPVVGALAVLAIPKAKESLIKWTALAFSLVTLGLVTALAVQFDYSAADTYQFGTAMDTTWISAINSHFHIGVDGISLPMVVLAAVITVLVIIYSWNHWPEPHNPKLLLAFVLILATGMTGTFVALDLVLFFVFFEVVLLPMYFMIGIWGDRAIRVVPVVHWKIEMRLYASLKFFLFTLFGPRSCCWPSLPSTSNRESSSTSVRGRWSSCRISDPRECSQARLHFWCSSASSSGSR